MTSGASEESFAENIESEWLRYLKYQEARLEAAGDQIPFVRLRGDGEGMASCVTVSGNEHVSTQGLNAAVELRIKYLTENPDKKERVRKARITKLRAELA